MSKKSEEERKADAEKKAAEKAAKEAAKAEAKAAKEAEKAAKQKAKEEAAAAKAAADALDEEEAGKRVRRSLAIKAIKNQVPLTKLPGLVENGFDAGNLYQSLNMIGRGDFDEVLEQYQDLYSGYSIDELIAETKDRLRTSSPAPDIGEAMSKTLANRRKAYSRNLTLKEKLYGDPQYGMMAELAADGYLDPPEDVYPTLKSIKESNAVLRGKITEKKNAAEKEKQDRRAYEQQTKDENSVIAEQERQRKEDERREKELRESAARYTIATGGSYERAEQIRQGIIPIREGETPESFDLSTARRKDADKISAEQEKARLEAERKERERREAYARSLKAGGASREDVEWVLQGNGTVPSGMSAEDFDLRTARILDRKDADREREKEAERKRREDEAAQEQQARDEDFDYLQQQRELQEKREIYAKQADVDNRLLGGEGITNLQRQSILNGWDSRIDDVLRVTDKDEMVETLARAQDRLGVKQDKESSQKEDIREFRKMVKLLTGINLSDKQSLGILKKFGINDFKGALSKLGLMGRVAMAGAALLRHTGRTADMQASATHALNSPAIAADTVGMDRESLNKEAIAGGQFGVKREEIVKAHKNLRAVIDALYNGDKSRLTSLAREGLALDVGNTPEQNLNIVEEFLNNPGVLDENKRNVINQLGLSDGYVRFMKHGRSRMIGQVTPEMLEERAVADEKDSIRDQIVSGAEAKYNAQIEDADKMDGYIFKYLLKFRAWMNKTQQIGNSNTDAEWTKAYGVSVEDYNQLSWWQQFKLGWHSGAINPWEMTTNTLFGSDINVGDDDKRYIQSLVREYLHPRKDTSESNKVTNVGGVTQVFNGKAEPEKVKEATESAIRNAGASIRTSSTSHEIGGRQQ